MLNDDLTKEIENINDSKDVFIIENGKVTGVKIGGADPVIPFKGGVEEIQKTLYQGTSKTYNITWTGNNSLSVSADRYNLGPNSLSYSPYADIKTMKTPDNKDGILININFVLTKTGHQPDYAGTGSFSCSAYVKSKNGSTLKNYTNELSNGGGTKNETYQLFATGYSYDTIRVGGSIAASAHYTNSNPNYGQIFYNVSLSGTVSYLISN